MQEFQLSGQKVTVCWFVQKGIPTRCGFNPEIYLYYKNLFLWLYIS